ncbi:MAG: precorrin-3B C(17)-methyltransferase [Thermodesulfovibrionales bacterium]|jgi:cobalt-precorrin 5A hydrolase/precorrin-3B C17-methyltransferase
MNTENKKTFLFYITENGLNLGRRIAARYPDIQIMRFKADKVPEFWDTQRNFIFVMAAGIVVRTIAPLLKNKKTDPAVLVLDDKGQSVISLLSGHLGGANEMAKEIANYLGGRAVITTASDGNHLPSIDLWARDNGLVVEQWELLPQIGTRLIDDGSVTVYTDVGIELPKEFLKVSDARSADILITNKKDLGQPRSASLPGEGVQRCAETLTGKGPLYLRPKNLIVGIGCNSKTSADEIEEAVRKTLDEHALALDSIHSVATIDVKADEEGLVGFARKYHLEITAFTPEELNSVEGLVRSEAAFKATGANGVAEPASLLSSGDTTLLVRKQRIGNVTVAVSEKKAGARDRQSNKQGVAPLPASRNPRGKIYVVGTGPGSIEHITPAAREAIRKSDSVVGYDTYLELIGELLKDKNVFSTAMTQEIDRCGKAVELAIDGWTVTVISGGDPGIYAMAGLVLELLKKQGFPRATLPEVEIIPGISALNACAARLGAPLMHDFATISLSDRLTPWESIEQRLDAAAKADFVIVLYNPKSRGRVEHIGRAREIILKQRDPETPVGIVKGAMREDETIVITDLQNMLDHAIDMQTTVVIGNSQTFTWGKWMITPRGYERKINS